ncbi:MAG TPA: glycosyltransferase [Conexibacter sp.]|jgi:glycosyltransferase involved in cell wall biosynthesis
MRITTISHPRLVNCNYRSYQPLMALEREGHTITVNRIDGPRYRESDLFASDVVHIHRYADDEVRQLVARLRASGIGIVWDNDDDESTTPRGNRLHREKASGLNAMRTARAIREIVQLADVVTTPSVHLADQYTRLGARDVRVLENYVADHYLRCHSRPHSGVVVGWLAGKEHKADYEGLGLESTFRRLLAERPNVSITSIGLGLGLQSERYKHIDMLRWMTDLAPGIAEFDIGIAPLIDVPFNRARSNIKVKEYAAVGVPWLASPIGPYARLGQAEGGRLVKDDEWLDSIFALVDDERRRRRLAKRCRKWVKAETVSRNAHRWHEVFEHAASIAKSRLHA